MLVLWQGHKWPILINIIIKIDHSVWMRTQFSTCLGNITLIYNLSFKCESYFLSIGPTFMV